MRNSIKSFLGLSILALAGNSHSWTTDFQLINTIEVLSDETIRVSTSENSNSWNVDGSGCGDQAAITISNTSAAREKMLSLLLFAKASGSKVRFQFTTCANDVAGTPSEAVVQ